MNTLYIGILLPIAHDKPEYLLRVRTRIMQIIMDMAGVPRKRLSRS